MIPLLKLGELFGVNVRENSGMNFKVNFANTFLFFLFGSCSIAIIWLAQKYIHLRKLEDLGFQSKIIKHFIFGFLIGALQISLYYLILMLNAGEIKYNPVIIPNDSSIFTYIGYYIYFFFGMIVWNSFIEELCTRAYPIETLKKHLNPHIIFVIMGILFTAGHFVIHEFSIGYCISLFLASYTFSFLYYFSKSIWLVIGMHSGLNWLAFSFFGTNWKLGALFNIQITEITSWVFYYTESIIGLLLLFLIIYANKKGFFKKFYP